MNGIRVFDFDSTEGVPNKSKWKRASEENLISRTHVDVPVWVWLIAIFDANFKYLI